jgi:FkbM family methyltransferase
MLKNSIHKGLRYLCRKLCGGCPQAGATVPKDAAFSFSQAGEDRVLFFLLNALGIVKPAYVDIGAHHPTRANSSFLLYHNGARGVCVEPNPELAAILRIERPEDTIVEAGVVPADGESLRYHMFQEPTFNTFSAEEACIRSKLGGDGGRLLRVVDVNTLTLDELMSRYTPSGLDVLAVDIEGLDEAIITGSSLIIRPKMIMIETVPFSNRHPVRKDLSIIEKMRGRGYHLIADTYVNTIFIDESLMAVVDLPPEGGASA